MEILNNLSEIFMDNYFLAPLIAFLAGVIASFLPCSLTSLPLLVAYISGADKKKAIKYSCLFAIGSTLMFVILGNIINIIGIKFNFLNKFIYIIFGVLMIICALYLLGIIKLPSIKLNKKSDKKSPFSAILMGIISATFSSPCSTPILIAILSISTTLENIVYTNVLLLFYGLGNAIIQIIFGSFISLTDKLVNSKKYEIIGKILNIMVIIFILIVGFYMLYLGF